MAKIGMIGAGSWGTALTYELTQKGQEVSIWSIDPKEVGMINTEHEQKVKLPGTVLPEHTQRTNGRNNTINIKNNNYEENLSFICDDSLLARRSDAG